MSSRTLIPISAHPQIGKIGEEEYEMKMKVVISSVQGLFGDQAAHYSGTHDDEIGAVVSCHLEALVHLMH